VKFPLFHSGLMRQFGYW